MSETAALVATLTLENRRLREELARLSLERDRLERALSLSHQLTTEAMAGWQAEMAQADVLRRRLESEELWLQTQEARAEMAPGGSFVASAASR